MWTLSEFVGRVFCGRGRRLRVESIRGETCWGYDLLREVAIIFPVRVLIDGWRRGRLTVEG